MAAIQPAERWAVIVTHESYVLLVMVGHQYWHNQARQDCVINKDF